MIEEWRKVEGFEIYEVSNLGRIKSFHYNRETFLTLSKNTNGYLKQLINFFVSIYNINLVAHY